MTEADGTPPSAEETANYTERLLAALTRLLGDEDSARATMETTLERARAGNALETARPRGLTPNPPLAQPGFTPPTTPPASGRAPDAPGLGPGPTGAGAAFSGAVSGSRPKRSCHLRGVADRLGGARGGGAARGCSSLAVASERRKRVPRRGRGRKRGLINWEYGGRYRYGIDTS